MRKRYIDYLRVISMLAVVMIHICTTAMTDFSEGVGTYKGVLFVSVTNLLHFAVPVFFMISGALLLNPKKEMTLERLLKRYILKYAGVILTFCWLFSFIEIVFDSHAIRPVYFLRSFLNMLQGKTWAHMWYMYTLLGVMLILPLLRWIVRMAERKDIVYLIIVFGTFLSILPCLRKVTGFELGIQFPIVSVYVLHMLLGYWIDADVIRWSDKVGKWILVCVGILLVIASYFQVISESCTGFIGEYYSPVMIIYSMALFMLIKNTAKRSDSTQSSKCKVKIAGGGVIDLLSEYSFGVYIIHMFWINLAYKLLGVNPFVLNTVAMIIFLWITIVVLSVLTTIFIKKIPILKMML